MNGYRSVLSELLLRLVNLTYEVNEAFSALRHALLWPIGKLKLSQSSGSTVSGIRHLEFS